MIAMDISPRAFRVWQRNRDVYLKLWRSELLMAIIEPILILTAMGFGLGAVIKEVDGRSYMEFIAPGILSTYIMFAAVFECTWGTYLRMQIQRTIDAIIVTPVNPQEVIVGELMWGTTRSLLTAVPFLIVISAAGLVHSPWTPLVLVSAVLGGLMTASFSMLFTSIVPSISSFNYFFSLFVTPMFYFSGVFFPLSSVPEGVRIFAWFLPLTSIARFNQTLMFGEPGMETILALLYMLGVTAVLAPLSVVMMKRRLIK